MKIKGIEGLDDASIQSEVERGGKFVMYTYCVSMLVLTFKRPTDIYFVRAGQSRLTPGLPFSGLSFLCGWWGLPWGIIYTIEALVKNFGGGVDVTQSVLASFRPANQPPPLPEQR